MTQRTWPLATQSGDSSQVSEADWSRFHTQVARAGVFGAPGDTTLKVVADPTGVRQVQVYPGTGSIFGYSYSSDENVVVNLDENTSGAIRYDVVVLRYDSSADDDDRISVAVVKGSAGSGVPAVQRSGTSTTGMYDIKLATIPVQSNAGTLTASSVSDDREFSAADVVSFSDYAHIDLTRVRVGSLVVTVSPPALYTWTGSVLADAVPRPQLPVQVNGSTAIGGTGDNNAPIGTFTAERSGTVLLTYVVEVYATVNNRVYAGLIIDGSEVGGATVAGQYGLLTFQTVRSITAGTHTLATRYFSNAGQSQIFTPRVIVQFF